MKPDYPNFLTCLLALILSLSCIQAAAQHREIGESIILQSIKSIKNAPVKLIGKPEDGGIKLSLTISALEVKSKPCSYLLPPGKAKLDDCIIEDKQSHANSQVTLRIAFRLTSPLPTDVVAKLHITVTSGHREPQVYHFDLGTKQDVVLRVTEEESDYEYFEPIPYEEPVKVHYLVDVLSDNSPFNLKTHQMTHYFGDVDILVTPKSRQE